jgi:hypothetical protein
MTRPRGKKTAQQPKQASARTTTSDKALPPQTNEAPAQAYTNARNPTSDTDSVVELRDDASIPDVFKAKKKARLSHIWLPENGIECVIDGVNRWKCLRCRLILFDTYLDAESLHVPLHL